MWCVGCGLCGCVLVVTIWIWYRHRSRCWGESAHLLLSRLEKTHNLCDLLGWQVTFDVVKIAIAAGAAAFDVKKAAIECTETKQGSSLVGRGVCAAE